MVKKALGILLGAALVVGGGATAWAQANGNAEKKVYTGPGETSFGNLQLVLGPGASAETQYEPDAYRLTVKTLTGEARVVTSARFLVLVENVEGTMEVLLPNGRKIVVEPGRSDIVGRAIVDDPGAITVRIATGRISVLEGVPAAALSGIVTTPSPVNPVTGPRPETSLSVSPSTPGSRGFGQ
jgi:hypothetical protein